MTRSIMLIGCFLVTGQDGNAGRYLLLALLTPLSQFGYAYQSTLLANAAGYLDKDTYFFKRSPTTLPPPPQTLMRGFESTVSAPSSKSGPTGIFSRLSFGSKEESKVLPDLDSIRSIDQSQYCIGRRFFCISIWRSNRMTILGCPDDTILDSITKAIEVSSTCALCFCQSSSSDIREVIDELIVYLDRYGQKVSNP